MICSVTGFNYCILILLCETVLLIITFVKATFVNYRCHYHHIRYCGVIWLAFTFSEELGFEEGGHGGVAVPMKLKSVNILAVCAPSYPFYGRKTSR